MADLKSKVDSALHAVMDPHMGVNLHDMGMVRGIDVDDAGQAEITIVFPCVGCPAYELIRQDIRKAASAIEGVNDVRVRVDWAQNWDKSDMAHSAVERARTHGYVI